MTISPDRHKFMLRVYLALPLILGDRHHMVDMDKAISALPVEVRKAETASDAVIPMNLKCLFLELRIPLVYRCKAARLPSFRHGFETIINVIDLSLWLIRPLRESIP